MDRTWWIVLLVAVLGLVGYYFLFGWSVCRVNLSPLEENWDDLSVLREMEEANPNFRILSLGKESLIENLESEGSELSLARLEDVRRRPELFEDVALVSGESKEVASIVFLDKCRMRVVSTKIPFFGFEIGPYEKCLDHEGSCHFWAGGWPWYAKCEEHHKLGYPPDWALLPTVKSKWCICTAKWESLEAEASPHIHNLKKDENILTS